MAQGEKPSMVIATKREALFMRVRDNLIKQIRLLEEDLEVNKEYLKLVKEIIKKENVTP